MKTPRVKDNDRDEITVTLDGIELRGWSYASEDERRWKMRMAREYVEGWYQAIQRADALAEALRKIAEMTVDPKMKPAQWKVNCSNAVALTALAAYDAEAK